MLFLNKNNSNKSTPKRRSNKYKVELTRSKTLHLNVRRFRPSKSRRSKVNKELVLPLKLLPIKEIGFKVITSKKKSKPIVLTLVIRREMVSVYLLLLTGMGGAGYFGLQVIRPPQVITPEVVSLFSPVPKTDYSKPEALSRAEPTSLNIPKINLNQSLLTVGRLADGTLETPNVLSGKPAWYKFSPTPGELGPSIIVGHVDSYKGPSIFWNLWKLVPGDNVEVVRSDGSMANFTVYRLQQFNRDNFPTEEIYGDTKESELRLITCGGIYDHKAGVYSANTVVFAKLNT